MASIVPCIHDCYGVYPNATTAIPSSTNDVIRVILIQQEFHRLTYHTSDDAKDVVTTPYKARKPINSNPLNPHCQQCEKLLIDRLTINYPLSYFSAEQVLHQLCDLLHHKHQQLQANKLMDGNMAKVEEVKYRLNYYFEKELGRDEDVYEGWACVDKCDGPTPAFGPGSETLVKVTVDGGWAVYLDPLMTKLGT